MAEHKEESLPSGGGAESFNVDAFVKSLTTRALGRRVEYRTRVASTMDVGAQLLSEGAPHGTLVLAEEQAAPQARKQGRTWSSTPRGNLYVSLLLRTTHLCWYGLQASAVAVVRACEDAGVQEARVKWPNDVWIGHRKVSGMIMRTEKELDVDSWKAQIGIGINVNEDMSAHPDLRDVAVSVGQALGGLWVNRERFLARYLGELEALLDTQDPRAVLAEYRRHSLLRPGTEVLVHDQGFEHAGYPAVVQAIADDFRLVVTRGGGGGDTISLSAEEVSVRPVRPSSSSSSSSE